MDFMAILKEEREKARQLKADGGHTSRATKKDESEESVDLSSKEEVECLYPVNIRLPALPVPKENNLLSNMGSDELMYFPDVVSVDEEEALWLTIQKQAEADGWVSLKGRQSMMLGEHKDAQGNHISQRLPIWLENIASHLPFFNLDEKKVNHVLINQYDEDGSIAFHTDGPSYLDRVCILSLGGPVILSFRERLKTSEIGIKEDKGDLFQVKMEPRSLLLFSGTVYSDMLHGIDPQTEMVDLKCLNRHLVPDPKQNVKGERISLTLRHALK